MAQPVRVPSGFRVVERPQAPEPEEPAAVAAPAAPTAPRVPKGFRVVEKAAPAVAQPPAAEPTEPGFLDKAIDTVSQIPVFGQAIATGARAARYGYEAGLAAPAGVSHGIEQVGEQAGTLADLATGQAATAPLPTPAPVNPVDALPLRQKIQDPAWTGKFAGEAAASSAPFLAAAATGGVGGFLLAGPPGALIGAMTMGGSAAGLQTLASVYQEARQSGQTHDQALDAAIASGLVSAGINAASIPAGLLRLAKGPLGYALTQLVVQPGIGAADQAAQNVVAQQTFDPKRSLGAGVPEAALGEALFEGPATVAGVVGAQRAMAPPAQASRFSQPTSPKP